MEFQVLKRLTVDSQYFFFPETRQLSLEEVDGLFSNQELRDAVVAEEKRGDIEYHVEHAGKTI